MRKLLIIDDEKAICSSLGFALGKDYEISTAVNLVEANHFIEKDYFDLVLLDLKFGEVSGIDLLEQIKAISPESIVIMMTAHGSIQSSIDAMKKGAYDYIMKPLDISQLKSLLIKANEYKCLKEKIDYLQNEVQMRYSVGGIIGNSKRMQDLFEMIQKVKDVDVNIILQGPSGTGKELVAKAIHYEGKRRKERFEAVNCGAIPDNLMESELFGYEKGAFTGAGSKKKGKFELAHKGTIFLDEIGELDLNLQVKLLRAIQQREVTPLGSEEAKSIDVRIIAATNKDLKKEVELGRFREDLYFRLNVIKIELPSLSKRKEDIPLLTQHFIEKCNRRLGKAIKGITQEALSALEAYDYPGNIRELENILERAATLTDHSFIELNDLPEDITRLKMNENLLDTHKIIPVKIGEPLDEVMRQVILKTLEAMEGNRKKTAEVLGISERNLRYKLKEYEVY
ncbi:sigma-54-dependent transcriptional regulator [Acidaminobacter hydrogenoformans]|uniref:Stage 0 sporulation protein A homolog n=1 Tax=Acidaminobacter hydrogenoformans DSM 2784 TaxID=1120920 RepID=A0A1G5S1J1_9FIRM|nr:sigma-54 dependent transcriptional regulator [Acidaminobacter hydrogenoformans]SCZ80252.1 regulatory protein, Fis family [Acidaminobacter hydrogenoformans DSM 2784]